MRVDERLARRRDPARRLRGPRLARRRAGRRGPGDGRDRVAGAAGDAGLRRALPARRRRRGARACPRWSSLDPSVDAEAVLGPGRRPSAWPQAGCPRCSTLVRARLRPVDPLDARGRAGHGAAGRARGGAGHVARRERAPAAAALRRRGRLRAEDARPGAALPALPRAVRRGRRPRAARVRRGLRRPGAPHARGAAALRAARRPSSSRPAPGRRANVSDSVQAVGAPGAYRPAG